MIELSTMFLKRLFLLIASGIIFFATFKLDSLNPVNNYIEYTPNSFDTIFRGGNNLVDERIKIVTVTYSDITSVHLTRGSTPTNALVLLGYPLTNRNRVYSTSPIDFLVNESHILVQTYNTRLINQEVIIPFNTVTKGSSMCPRISSTIVEQEGVSGRKKQTIEKFYLGEKYISERIISEVVESEPVTRIITLSGASDLPQSVTQLGPRCDYWEGVVNSLDASDEEKQWLRFTMRWESGCNAENNKSTYKGLFQWEPCLWYRLYPNDNIFDGKAQINRTLQKIRLCADPAKMWPGVYKKYVQTYGELSSRYTCGYL